MSTRISSNGLVQSCPWVGLTRGLGWVGSGMGRKFVFSGLGWVMGLKWQMCEKYMSFILCNFVSSINWQIRFVKTCGCLHCYDVH